MMLNASSNSPSSPRGGLEQEAPAGSLAIAGQEDAMSMGLLCPCLSALPCH